MDSVMNAQTERLTLHGSAGAIEALRDSPALGWPLRGVAVIAHPTLVWRHHGQQSGADPGACLCGLWICGGAL